MSFGATTSVEIKHKSHDLNKVHQELERKRREQQQLEKEASELTKSLKDNDRKLKSVEQSLLHTKEKNWEVQQDLAQTKNSRDRTLKDIEDDKEQLRKTFQLYYVSADLTGSYTPVTVLSYQVYRSHLDHYKGLRDKADNENQTLAALTSNYEIIQSRVRQQESLMGEMQSGKVQKQKLLEKKLTRRQVIEGELKDLQKSEEELASMIDVLRSKAKQEQQEEKRERQAKAASGASPIQRASLPWPFKGDVVRKFGKQKDTELSTPYISNGIIIESDTQQPVRAVADGQVLFAGKFMSYGSMVVVEHPGDWYSVYGRLGHWTVEKGVHVKAGDQIGDPGTTSGGRAESYFELRFYGKPRDPLPWLEQ